MKTYHQYQMDSKQAEESLKKVQSHKAKVEQQLSGKSLSGSRKFRKIEKQEDEVCFSFIINSALCDFNKSKVIVTKGDVTPHDTVLTFNCLPCNKFLDQSKLKLLVYIV